MRIDYDVAERCFDLYTENNEHIGEITYRTNPDGSWIANHTGVRPAHEGKGYAAQLLDAMVREARAQGVKIVPVCPYVVAVFKKYPDKYADVIK